MIEPLRFLLLVLIAAVPLTAIPTLFLDGFVTPRHALVAAALCPLALFLAIRTPGAIARARVFLLATAALWIAGVLPHVLQGPDANALALHSVRLVLPMAFVLAGAALSGSPWRARLVATIAISCLLSLAITMARRHAGIFEWIPDRNDVSPSGLIGNSNALAEVFAPLAAAAIARLACGASVPVSAAIIGGCGLALVGISRSRGGALALAVGFIVAGIAWIMSGTASLRWRRASTLGGALAFVALLVVLLPQAAPIRDAAKSVADSTSPTSRVRLGLWEGTADLIRDHLPFGVGGGRFEAAFLPYRQTEEWALSGVDTRADDPHQEFLRTTAECGLIGLLAFAAMIGLGIFRGLKAWRQGDPAGAPLLAATAALIVTSCLRAPFGHAGGTLAFGLLLGATGIAPVDRANGDRLARRAGWVLAVLGGLASLLVLADDRTVGAAVSALNRGKGALVDGNAEVARNELREAGRRLKFLPGSPLKDPGRSFRAALASDELEHARSALAAAGVGDEVLADFPDAAVTDALIAATNRAVPHHPGAAVLGARRARESDRIAEAVQTLRDGIDAIPNAPRLRRNLAALLLDEDAAGVTALRLIVDEEIRFGASRDLSVLKGRATLEAQRERRLTEEPLPKASTPAPSVPTGSSVEALHRLREELLVGLCQDSNQPSWWAALAETDFSLAISRATGTDSRLQREGSRAYARARLGFALEAEAQKDRPSALRFLRLALRKDPELRAARELALRWGEPVGDPVPPK